MKTALYIADGILQAVLTPETEQEKRILDLVDMQKNIRMYRGQFYYCQGGWERHGPDEESLIMVLKDKEDDPCQK